MEAGMMLAIVLGALILIGLAKSLLCSWLCANPKILAIIVVVALIGVIYYLASNNELGLSGFFEENFPFLLVFIQVAAMFAMIAMKHYVLGTLFLFTSLASLFIMGFFTV